MSTATVTSKGQITIPKSIRERLNIQAGDRVNFFVDNDDIVTFLPAKTDIRELKGIIPKPRIPVTIEDMSRAIKDGGSKI